jgi:hypothetical protein
MQPDPIFYGIILILGALPWIIGSFYLSNFYHRNPNLLSKSILILNMCFGAGLLLIVFNFFYPTSSPILALADYSYSILFLIGTIILFYAMLKIFYPKIKFIYIVILLVLPVILFKTYNLVDWIFLDIPLANEFNTVANLVFASTMFALLITIIFSTRKTKIVLLRNKMIILATSFLALFIELLIVSITISPVYEYRFVLGAGLIWPFTILGAYSVIYKSKHFVGQLGLEAEQSNILNENDERLVAFLCKYTSKEQSCEFYDPLLNSKCKLDPATYRISDCKGLKYQDGILCYYLKRLDGYKTRRQLNKDY